MPSKPTSEIKTLKSKIKVLESKIQVLEAKNQTLITKYEDLRRKVQTYEQQHNIDNTVEDYDPLTFGLKKR